MKSFKPTDPVIEDKWHTSTNTNVIWKRPVLQVYNVWKGKGKYFFFSFSMKTEFDISSTCKQSFALSIPVKAHIYHLYYGVQHDFFNNSDSKTNTGQKFNDWPMTSLISFNYNLHGFPNSSWKPSYLVQNIQSEGKWQQLPTLTPLKVFSLLNSPCNNPCITSKNRCFPD